MSDVRPLSEELRAETNQVRGVLLAGREEFLPPCCVERMERWERLCRQWSVRAADLEAEVAELRELSERGPWREAMVPRAALEWLAENRGLGGCPAEWCSISPLPCSGEGICPYDRVDRDTKCWADTALLVAQRDAALAAAEEADNALGTD